MRENRDYKEDIEINEADLENEWIMQPTLYLHYADAHADALHERDMAKAKLEYTYAKMYSDIKKNWEKYFDSKPTEPAIKEHILSSSDFKKVEAKYIKACYNANALLAAKTAFDQRKVALQNLVQLRVSGIYAEPKAPKTKKDKGGHAQRKAYINKTNRTKRNSKKN
jgi:hypothetical protein